MPSLNQRKVTIILAAALLAVVGASTAILLLLPGSPEESAVPADRGEDTGAPTGTTDFNLRVLDRSGYQSLNSSLLQNGLLPVKPPANVGKANPFL